MSLQSGVLSAADSHVALLPQRLDRASRGTCLDIVAGAEPTRRNVMTVSCRLSADEMVDRWRDRVGSAPAKFGVVAVGERSRSVAPAETPDRGIVRTVADPGALTRLRESVEDYLAEWDATDDTVVYLDAVDALVDHASLPAVVGFLDRLTDSLSAVGAVGCASFATGKRNGRAMRPVTELFGSVLELDEPDALTDGDRPPSDQVFEVLSTRRRRRVLRHLLYAGEPLHLRELAERLVDDGSDVADDERVRREYTGLHHVALPKLTEAGVVTVEDRVVSLTSAVDAVVPHLALSAPSETEGPP